MMFYIIILLGVIIDLVSKYIASIFVNEKFHILGDILYLLHIKNDGIAFSIDIPFLKIVTIVLILAIFYYYFTQERQKQSWLVHVSFGLILAGALGNGIERIIYGQVTDFIALQGFAIFNIADSYISLGAIIYIYYTYIGGISDHKK